MGGKFGGTQNIGLLVWSVHEYFLSQLFLYIIPAKGTSNLIIICFQRPLKNIDSLVIGEGIYKTLHILFLNMRMLG